MQLLRTLKRLVLWVLSPFQRLASWVFQPLRKLAARAFKSLRKLTRWTLSITKRFARWFWPISLLLLIAAALAEADQELTQALCISFAIGWGVFTLLNRLRKRIWPEANHRIWRRTLLGLAGAVAGIIGMAGVIESYEGAPVITVLSAEAAFFFPAGAWFFLSNGEWPGLRARNPNWWKIGGICFGIAITLLFIVMIAYEFEPVVDLLAGLYFLAFVAFGVRWLVRQILAILRLRKEKKAAELQHLKSQVNPHFFFNMLNNLYGLVEQDGKKAKQLILKLSELMRYGIYEGQKERVPLSGEIEHLRNYVALHRMRYHKEIEVDFELDLVERDWQVMPLLFIILLENAFKHGVENLRRDAYVKVILRTTDESLRFRVENNYDPEETDHPPGIGLENLERRLQLAYPDQHHYSVHQTVGTYAAELILHEA